MSFALTENRFNVATSRSRSTTLIICDVPLEDFITISPKVSKYLSLCTYIERDSTIVKAMNSENNISQSISILNENIKEIQAVNLN